MRIKKRVMLAIGVFVLSQTVNAESKTMRATEIGPKAWSDISRGNLNDTIVEFHQGDELPVSFEAEGDLLETTRSSVSFVLVKKNFWLQLNQNKIQLSLDGVIFKNLGDFLSGGVEAGAGSAKNGGIADAINVVFKAYLK